MRTFITQIYIILIFIVVNSMAIYAGEPPVKDSAKKEKTTNRSLIENGEPNLSVLPHDIGKEKL